MIQIKINMEYCFSVKTENSWYEVITPKSNQIEGSFNQRYFQKELVGLGFCLQDAHANKKNTDVIFFSWLWWGMPCHGQISTTTQEKVLEYLIGVFGVDNYPEWIILD